MRDDDLRDRLAELAAEARGALPNTRDVRARGDRRRIGVTTAAVGLSLLAVGAGAVGISFVAAPTASFPGGDSSPEPSALPSSGAIPTPSPDYLVPTGAPATSYPPSPAQTFPAVTKIPATLSMLHEGEAGWTTNTDVNVPSAFNPCGGVDVTIAGRTDARTLKGPGLPGEESHSPSKVTHQLFLYSSEQAATAAFVELSAGQCGWLKSVMNPGDAESTHLARLRKSESYTPEPGVYWLHDADLVRTGNALLIAYADASGGGMTSNLADQELDNILAPLCRAQLVCR
jgi:hypothetical protein